MNLARLAHFLIRRRWPVIGAWLALTLFGAVRRRPGLAPLAPELLRPRQASLRGEPADAEGVRRRPRAPSVVVFHTRRRRDDEPGDRRRRCSAPRRRCRAR